MDDLIVVAMRVGFRERPSVVSIQLLYGWCWH